MPGKHSPELRHLRYAVAIADTGSIAAAARREGVAQPALSRQLRDLEAMLGVDLFHRQGRGAPATPAGERFVADARDILARTEAAAAAAARMGEGLDGSLVVGFNETASWGGVIPDTLRAFRQRYPRVALTAVPMSSVEQRLGLDRGEIDAGFLYALRGGPTTVPLAAVELSVEPLMLAVRADDPLAAFPGPVALATLADRPLIWFDRAVSPTYFDEVACAFAAAGVKPMIGQRTTNTSAMLALVNAGAGYTFVPASASCRKPADVVLRALSNLELPQTLRLAWRRSNTSALVHRLVATAGSLIRSVADGRVTIGSR